MNSGAMPGRTPIEKFAKSLIIEAMMKDFEAMYFSAAPSFTCFRDYAFYIPDKSAPAPKLSEARLRKMIAIERLNYARGVSAKAKIGKSKKRKDKR